MLKITPKFSLFTPPTLAPVTLPVDDDENDELITAINDDHQVAEKNWELTDIPDVPQLEQFWSGVAEDLQSDPEWFNFVSDDSESV